MKVSLSTSLHLDHGIASVDLVPGDPPRMQAFVPVGLLSLKAAAEANLGNQQIRIAEINGLINAGIIRNDDSFYENLADQVWDADDDFFGLMTDADSLPHTIVTAYHLKKRSPHSHVCMGGPAVSPISTLVLQRFPFVDSICRGESELTFCDLLRELELKHKPERVQGLTWRDGERVVVNADRPLIDDVDELPVPAFDSYNMTSGAPLYLDVGRGCPFKCRFCATAPFWNRRYRMKSTNRIIAEMQLVRDRYERNHVNFSHDIFTCDRDWTLAFCQRLIAEPLGMTWSCSTRTDIINPELLAEMAKAGCTDIYYGIETGSKSVQKDIDKGLDLEWSRTIVKTTRDVGIRSTTGFIVGHPTDTMDTLGDTLERFFEFLRLGGHRAHLFVLCPFQGAPMFSQFANTIERSAEYADLPLTCRPSTEVAELKHGNRDIFASSLRFATPNLPSPLVDASEEISCHLVVLKNLWPLLLPYYKSALDLYSRWTEWIRAYNEEHRPTCALRHQGNAYDLLHFSETEVERLGLQDSDIAELIQYERAKLDARNLLDPSATPTHVRTLNRESVIKLRCHYTVRSFRYDLSGLLSGGHNDSLSSKKNSFVVFAKTNPGAIDTLQVSRAGKHLLEILREPKSVNGVIDAMKTLAQVDYAQSIELIRNFCGRGLLTTTKELNASN